MRLSRSDLFSTRRKIKSLHGSALRQAVLATASPNMTADLKVARGNLCGSSCASPCPYEAITVLDAHDSRMVHDVRFTIL